MNSENSHSCNLLEVLEFLTNELYELQTGHSMPLLTGDGFTLEPALNTYRDVDSISTHFLEHANLFRLANHHEVTRPVSAGHPMFILPQLGRVMPFFNPLMCHLV